MTTLSVIEEVRSFSFANKHWPKTGTILECPPGTWCKPYPGSPPEWAALVCCPNCKAPAAISKLVHKIDYRGRLSLKEKPNRELWTCPKCKLSLKTMLNAWGKQTLFGIAYYENYSEEVAANSETKAKMIYKHADDMQEAKRDFIRAYPMKGIRIVAIGQVLGYYSEDRDDKVLAT